MSIQTLSPIPASYLALQNRLGLNQGIPFTENWSAAADFLQIIVEHCLNQCPTTIVECSSGLTTLMLAKCCQLNQHGQVYSLENGEEYAERTLSSIKHYQLQSYVSIIHAPLVETRVNNRDFKWYARDKLPNNAIDMLVIDGPPGFIQPHSRYPALPLLFGQMANGCTVFLDDAARADEQEIINQWRQQFPDLHYDWLSTERGCAMFKKPV